MIDIDATVRSMGRTPLILALAFAAALANGGWEAFGVLKAKAAAQIAVTESVERWKSSYLALADSVRQWEKNYRTEESIQDQASLYDELNLSQYGFTFDMDSTVISRIEPVTSEGIPIGLTKVCLSQGLSGDGLEIRATSYTDLLAGLKKLAERPDIFVGTIMVKSNDEKAVPGAVLGNFCLLLRKGGGR